IRIAASDAGGFTIGGVVIAERHTAQRSEAARLLAKGIEGCGYCISQTVYSGRPTQRLLRDYLRDCRGAGSEPRRVVLSFAPCGREKTLAFLRWLGVTVAPDTERAILGAADPLAKSIEICRDNLRRILDEPYAGEIPLGVNVESVSINRDEIDASIDLFHALREARAGKWNALRWRRKPPGKVLIAAGAEAERHRIAARGEKAQVHEPSANRNRCLAEA